MSFWNVPGRTLCDCMLRLTYVIVEAVVVVVVFGATTVSKAIYRGSELLQKIAHFKELWRQQ